MFQGLDSDIFPLLSARKLGFILGIKPSWLRELAKTAGSYYKPFDRKQVKDDGGIKWRHIDNPTGDLKRVQGRINKRLLKNIMLLMPQGIMGGITGKSILDNAMQHIDQEMVVTIDLKDCFPRTSHKRVFAIWRNDLACGEEVASILTQLTTFQTRLPQGAPTSLALCNLALLPLYVDIKEFSVAKGVNSTTWVDDIAISGKAGLAEKTIGSVARIIQKHGYAIRRSKIKVMPANTPQRVTGVVVNKKASIALKDRQGIRDEILNLSKKRGLTEYDLQVIWGKINHVSNISDEQGEKLASFAQMLLPKSGRNFRKRKKGVIRSCKSTKRHIFEG